MLRLEHIGQVLEDSVGFWAREWAISGMQACQASAYPGLYKLVRLVCCLPAHLFISLCAYPLIYHTLLFNQSRLTLILSPSTTMVLQTQPKNKSAHPAAPVMSEAAKVKAGIVPAKPHSKRMTKDARIQELKAQIAQFEKPDDPHPSKEPLVRASPLTLTCHGMA